MRSQIRTVALVALLWVAGPVACVAPGYATADPSETDPATSRTNPPEMSTPLPSGSMYPGDSSRSPDCYTMTESVDAPPPSIKNLVPISSAVVIGRVASVEPGRWNTSDGAKPTDPRGSGPKYQPGIVTPVVVEVERSLVGDSVGELTVLLEGGVAGCIAHRVYPSPLIEPKRSYAFLLRPSRQADGTIQPEAPQVIAAWPIDDVGQIQTPVDGALSATDFAAAVADAAP